MCFSFSPRICKTAQQMGEASSARLLVKAMNTCFITTVSLHDCIAYMVFATALVVIRSGLISTARQNVYLILK